MAIRKGLLGAALWAALVLLPQGAEARERRTERAPERVTDLATELNGQTWFTSPPWKVEFTNYWWYLMQAGVEYYFTVTLADGAGAGLGGMVIQQTRGADREFPFFTQRTRAFVGRPRREGAPIPVQASFEQASRTMTVRFPEPPQPGQTVTLALQPVHNPTWADTYMFSVQALPAGPNPVPVSLGFATMPIYNLRP